MGAALCASFAFGMHAGLQKCTDQRRALGAPRCALRAQQMGDSERAGEVRPALRIPRVSHAGGSLLSARSKTKKSHPRVAFFLLLAERVGFELPPQARIDARFCQQTTNRGSQKGSQKLSLSRLRGKAGNAITKEIYQYDNHSSV